MVPAVATRNALIVAGGWATHEPEAGAERVRALLAHEGVAATVHTSLDPLGDPELLRAQALVVPIWTMGEIPDAYERTLVAAVRDGVGLAGFHGGMGDSFRSATDYQWVVGGQFVAHPDEIVDYRVELVPGHPLAAGLDDFDVRSEQYYMHVDPSNDVVATTTFRRPDAPWIDGVVMPVAWCRRFGRGRVFYSSLGHTAAELDRPPVRELLHRGLRWALGRWPPAT